MNKRLVSIIFVLLILAAIPVTVLVVRQRQEIRKRAAPATTLSFSPASVTKRPGETFTLDVRIDTGENTVSAAELVILVDPTKLKPKAITAGSFLPVVLVAAAVTDSRATITLGSPPTAPKEGTGTLATVTFEVVGESGTAAIRFAQETQVAGIGEQGNVLVGATPATVTISASLPSPTPTPIVITPSPTPTGQVTPSETPTPTPTDTSGGEMTLSVTYPASQATVATSQPIIQGTAKMSSTVTITIYSDPITAVVTADSSGSWQYTPTVALADGSHRIVLTEQALDGTTRTSEHTFFVQTAAIPVSGSPLPLLLLLWLALLLAGGGLVTLRR